MADFKPPLRRHYESQRLPEERARAILAAGRAAAARARRARWLGAAAALAIGLAIYGGLARFRGGDSSRIGARDAATAVVDYFSAPGYQLPAVSPDRAVLKKWLRDHGAPRDFTIPPAMAGLPAFGCQVLGTHGQKVFLMCFFLDGVPAEAGAAGAMPPKQEMVVTAPDGTMMKKKRPLVHLVVAPRAVFRDAPAPGSHVKFSATGGWNFETWSQGDLVYLIAAAAPGERLAELAGTL